jgi:very-short-patch-repair endonuclease
MSRRVTSPAGPPADPSADATTPQPADASPTTALEPLLLEVARGQHGMFTTEQAAKAGVSSMTLVSLVKAGVLRHPGRGLYAVESLVAPGAGPEQWHRQLCAGAFLVYPDAVLAGTSALLAHGIPVWGAALAVPSILRPVKRCGGMSAFWVRPLRGATGRTDWGPASALPEALVQHALDRGIVPGVVSADAALRERRVTVDEIVLAAAAVETWPHASRAASMLAFLDGRRESVGESRCGVALAMAGIRALPQVSIHEDDGRFVARVDFLVEGTRVVLEFDGKVKYASGDPQVLWDEKRREDRLRRLGYVVVRLTWADLERPGAVAAVVRAALRAAS